MAISVLARYELQRVVLSSLIFLLAAVCIQKYDVIASTVLIFLNYLAFSPRKLFLIRLLGISEPVVRNFANIRSHLPEM